MRLFGKAPLTAMQWNFKEVPCMSGVMYLVGAVYLASTLARLVFRAVDVIEGRR